MVPCAHFAVKRDLAIRCRMKKRSDKSIAAPLDEAREDARFVTALSRGLDVLKSFRKGDAGLGNQELSERTGFPKSTISRLTYTLAALGYLHYSADTGRYSLSASVLSLGLSALAGLAVRDIARPLLQEVAERTGASTAMAVPDERTMIYIESCRGSSPLRLGIEIGSHIKMGTSSLGRAYLASLDPAAREARLIVICAADEANANSIRTGVEQAIVQYRAKGFVTSVGEWRQEINSVGVPVVLGGQHYAINCGGSALVLDNEKLEEIGEQLVRIAQAIIRATC
jgi:DNA-binding IclR family transcriptional regulator